jgi:FKBP-type peptidyl-prolyl cis-trans isomerase FkpA
MRFLFSLFAAALLAAPLAAQDSDPQAATAPPELASEESKALYALGFTLWKSLDALDLSAEEADLVRRAFDDAVAGREPAIDPTAYKAKIQSMARERAARHAEVEKQRGEAFVAGEAAEEGAVLDELGYVYRELTAGDGASPSADDTVRVHYRGTLIDGTEFDSSYSRGEPAEFPLRRVVRCWTEGIQRMKVGGKARLVCPASLAYGDRGRPSIPPGATLIFEIELLGIGAAPAAEE